MYIKKSQAERLGKHFQINFEVVPFEEWHHGLNVELEHGSKFVSLTNVTNNALKQTAKIVMAHLIEDPRYYHYLKKMEDKRDKYWSTRTKPNIFLA
jgi:hypothetical protein